MKVIISLLLFCLLSVGYANNSNVDKTTILVVGDSWAHLVCSNYSIPAVLRSKGLNKWTSNYHPDNKIHIAGCGKQGTVRIGAVTEEFLPSSKLGQRVSLILKNDPSIKIVYLSIGGNDMFWYWDKEMTLDEGQSVFEDAYRNTKIIIEEMLSIRPDIKILISGYDYPNFTNKTDWNKIPLYRKFYNDMKQPSVEELNSALEDFTIKMQGLANGDNVAYIHHLGLMLHYFGSPEHDIKKQTLPLPEISDGKFKTLSVPKGNKIPTPINALAKGRVIFDLFIDPFHLSSRGYFLLVEHSFEIILKDWLK